MVSAWNVKFQKLKYNKVKNWLQKIRERTQTIYLKKKKKQQLPVKLQVVGWQFYTFLILTPKLRTSSGVSKISLEHTIGTLILSGLYSSGINFE